MTLPPLPAPARSVVYNESKGYGFYAYTAAQMENYARAAIAAHVPEAAFGNIAAVPASLTDEQIIDLWAPMLADGVDRRPVGGRNKIVAFARAVLAAVPAQPVAFRVRLDGMWFHGASREGLIAAIGVKLGRSIAEQEVEPLYAAPQAVPVPAGWSVTYDGKRASYIYADQETAEFEAQQVGGTARAVAVYLASAPKEQPHE